jgi:hypothetical protein
MSDLRPCPRCSRHVDASERACPFCSGALAGASPGKVRLVSRRELTRAAVFAGAALLAGACGGPSAPADDLDAPDDSSGSESQGTDLSHASDDGSGGAREEATEETEADAEARREAEARMRAVEEEQRRLMEDQRRHPHRQCTPEGICPPYGAPPMPDALV